MSDQNVTLSKDPVSLADLKRAIAEYERFQYPHNLADAWRTAFEWREGLLDRAGGPGEYHEGMALIREKLQS